jgi:glucosamine-6-phosphate deaminase
MITNPRSGIGVRDPSRTPSSGDFSDYLRVSAADLGKGQPVKMRVVGDAQSLAGDLAETMLAEIREGERSGQGATLIVPVGPVDQFPILARLINEQEISCCNSVFINMDEYLGNDNEWIRYDHPLSFRACMDKAFYNLLEPCLAPPMQHRVFPDPNNLEAIAELIDSRGGVDACFGGIGINGHLAFNEPPEPNIAISLETFAASSTRTIRLSRETRTINSVTVGGEISIIPENAITIGMKEILGSRKLRFYCNRQWQSGVVRRALHGPLSPAFPASFLRLHRDASVTVTDFVAAAPTIQLR